MFFFLTAPIEVKNRDRVCTSTALPLLQRKSCLIEPHYAGSRWYTLLYPNLLPIPRLHRQTVGHVDTADIRLVTPVLRHSQVDDACEIQRKSGDQRVHL